MSAPVNVLPPGIAHPFSPAGKTDPFPAYRWLQQHAPVYHDPFSRMWLVTGHSSCVALLRDDRFSAERGQRGRTRPDALPPSMLTTDPPDHQRLRAPGALLLGPAAIRSITDGLSTDIDELLASLAGCVDALEDIGLPLVVCVFARLFGIDAADRPEFVALAAAAAVNIDPLADADTAAAGRAAMGELTVFLRQHAATAAASPLARLVSQAPLTQPEILGILGLAVVGGWQPLAEMVGNALYWLLPRPDAMAALAGADDDRARLAMDELLRLEAPIPFTARVATRPVDLPGGAVPAGAWTLVVVAAANRDPQVFDRPDELVLDRSPNAHLAFGFGAHFCLAAPLVRAVGAMLLPRLARLRPRPIDPVQEFTWDPRPTVRRLLACPVELAGRG